MTKRLFLAWCILFFHSFFSARAELSAPGLLPVPIVRQATNYSCGAAALLSLLYYWKVSEEGELALHPALKTTPELGTDYPDIVRVAREHGLEAELKLATSFDDLKRALDRNEPPIVEFQAWGGPDADYKNSTDNGHYAVVTGLSVSNVYFMDPVVPEGYAYLPREEFLSRWHDAEVRDGKRIPIPRPAFFIKGRERLNAYPGPSVKIE